MTVGKGPQNTPDPACLWAIITQIQFVMKFKIRNVSDLKMEWVACGQFSKSMRSGFKINSLKRARPN